MLKLIQDNPLNGINGYKLEVKMTKEKLHYEIIKYFKWRKNKNDIDYNIKRFKKLGTSKHDEFIKYLYSQGY